MRALREVADIEREPRPPIGSRGSRSTATDHVDRSTFASGSRYFAAAISSRSFFAASTILGTSWDGTSW